MKNFEQRLKEIEQKGKELLEFLDNQIKKLEEIKKQIEDETDN
jgi:DNA topoisomerase IA